MQTRTLLASLVCATLLLGLVPVQPALAAPAQRDEVILRDDLTLQAGEHVTGDLVIIAGDLAMRPGSRVEGSVTALGGRVEVNGTVEGDLVVVGGDVTLGPQARVQGDVMALGGRVDRSAGAVTGDVVQGPAIGDLRLWQVLRSPFIPLGAGARPETTVAAILTTLVIAAALALLGAAVTALWPAQTATAAETVLKAPWPSLGVGCLLYPLAASLILFVLVTICLAPIAPALVLVLVAASLFGWIALGMLWGRRLTRWIGWRRATPQAAAGLGVFVLTVLAAVAGVIPCLGALLVLGAASIGLGGVTLSRFGNRRYRRPTTPQVPNSQSTNPQSTNPQSTNPQSTNP